MAPDPKLLFATYLLPPFNYPQRRRQSSSVSASSEDTVPSLYSSPTSSPGTSPGSSPPNALFTLPKWKGKGILYEALHKEVTQRNAAVGKPKVADRVCSAHPNTLRCLSCATDIAFVSQIVSKGFTGRHGRAYLVSSPPAAPYNWKMKAKLESDLINTSTGRSVSRELLTGLHVVADVSCAICGSVLGWKYVDAKEPAQRYKIGKFILEMKRVVMGVHWEDGLGTYVDQDADDSGHYSGHSKAQTNKNGIKIEGDIVFDSEDEDECDDLFAGVWDAEVVAKRRARKVVVKRKILEQEADAEAV